MKTEDSGPRIDVCQDGTRPAGVFRGDNGHVAEHLLRTLGEISQIA